LWPNLRYYPDTCLGGQRTTKNLARLFSVPPKILAIHVPNMSYILIVEQSSFLHESLTKIWNLQHILHLTTLCMPRSPIPQSASRNTFYKEKRVGLRYHININLQQELHFQSQMYQKLSLAFTTPYFAHESLYSYN
jgi:hypothetical protein